MYSSTIDHLYVQSYLGKWYEAASIPTWSEEGYEGATAKYSLCECGEGIRIINMCYIRCRRRIRIRSSEGFATIPNLSDPGKLRVTFPGSLYQNLDFSSNPAKTNYWIHDTDYNTYAIVGSEHKNYLWLLVRTPCISRRLYDWMISRAQELGYDTSKICMSHMMRLVQL